MPDNEEQTREKAGDAIRLFIQTDRMHKNVFDNQVQKLGLHRSQQWVLTYLSRHGEIGSQKQIADSLEISPAAVTVTLKKLESLGYVERTVSPSDNRNHLIQLTGAGTEILEKTRSIFRDIDLRMLSGLTDSQLDIFMECNRRIQENLRSLGGSVHSFET